MKITAPTSHPAIKGESVEKRPAGGGLARPDNAGATTVALSPAARAWACLSETSGDIDLEKVQSIRSAIAAGKLNIHTEKIADGLIDMARALFKPQE